jgi:hypothetical protein
MENTEHAVCMKLNNGGSHVCIETVYHKNLVLCGHSFMLVTKLNSMNLDWLIDWEGGRVVDKLQLRPHYNPYTSYTISVSGLNHIYCTFCSEWPFLKTWTVPFLNEWRRHMYYFKYLLHTYQNMTAHFAYTIYQPQQGMQVSLNMLLDYKTLQINSQE